MIHFEDHVTGTVGRFGRYAVTRDEVIEFAGKYDPHPFHLSDEAAAETFFGRLSASGWHTCSMTMAMFVAHIHDTPHASHGGAGIDDLRWLKPVYPGDVLTMETEILRKQRSRSRADLGRIWTRMTTYNQDGVAVLNMVAIGLYAVRDPSAPIADEG